MVSRKPFANFWKQGAGFYLDGTSFTHKVNLFDKARALEKAWSGKSLGKDLILVSLEKIIAKARKGMLLNF